MTSLEISCIHAAGAILEPNELFYADRYFGDGYSAGQLNEFIWRGPNELLTRNEARDIVRRVTRGAPRA